MDEDTLLTAMRLRDKRRAICAELDIWEKEITSCSRLGYRPAGCSELVVKLKSLIPEAVFMSFRDAAMNALKLQLLEIEKEFSEL